jgi:integrase
MGLRWTDLDGDRLRVQRVLVPGSKGTWRLEEPKTAKSRRAVTLPATAVRALQAHRARQAEEKLRAGQSYEDNGFVFAGPLGRPVDMRSLVRNHFQVILKSADVPLIRLYDLRHTSATLLLAEGVHPKIVSERLGHSTVMLTLDTYSHVLPDMQQHAAEQIEKLLSG